MQPQPPRRPGAPHTHFLRESDWNRPIDASAELAALPPEGWVRGVFMDAIARELVSAGHGVGSFGNYNVLSKYPFPEYMKLLAHAAEKVHPDVSMREGLRRLGRRIYPAFFESMVGKAIFAVAGKDFRRALELCHKAYEVGASHGKVRLVTLEDGYAYAELRNVWCFTEPFQVGVWEGAMAAFGLVGTARHKSLSACDLDIELVWH